MTENDVAVGKFKLESGENFDEFLKALGVDFITRKVASNLTPVIDITKNNDEYSVKTSTTFKNQEVRFKLGQEFEEKRMDGVLCKSLIEREGNILIQKQEGKGIPCEIIREFDENGLKTICKCKDVVSTRFYKRVA